MRELELEHQLREAIVFEMRAKGFTFSGSAPRMLFSVKLDYLGEELSQSNPPSASDKFEQVSCVVTITEPKSGSVMWRGLYRGAVNVEVDEQEQNAQVRDGIRRMIRDFPPADGLRVP